MIGYRVWTTSYPPSSDIPCLHSVVCSYQWNPGANTADCSWWVHTPPAKDCCCGFWIVERSEEALNFVYGWRDTYVLGIVEAWGRIIEHEKGYRCQYAAVTGLYLRGNSPQTNHRIRSLAERFDVPILSASDR